MGRKATGLLSLNIEYGSRVTKIQIAQLDKNAIVLFTTAQPFELPHPLPYLNHLNTL